MYFCENGNTFHDCYYYLFTEHYVLILRFMIIYIDVYCDKDSTVYFLYIWQYLKNVALVCNQMLCTN